MPEFANFADLAKHLQRVARAVPKATERALEQIGTRVEKSAKKKIGNYQLGSGDFPAWTELADATKSQRLQEGFTENDPLIRTGELYASISHSIAGSARERVLSVGSDLDLGLWQELGTDKIPPRPFIGPSMLENEAKAQEILGKAVEILFAKGFPG